MVIEHWNQEKNKVIVLFSGYMFGSWTYKNLIPLLSDYHVIVFGGLGASTSYVDGKSHFSTVEYIDKYLSSRLITNIILIGHSMGGFVAQLFAGRYPGKVIALILVGTCCPIDFLKSHRSQSSSLLKYLFQLDIEGFFKMTTYSLFTERFLSSEENLSRLRSDFFSNMPIEKACVEQLLATDELIEWMKHNKLVIASKTLVVIGGEDKVVLPEWSLELAGKIDYCDYEIINDSGHFIMYEDPNETYTAITSWLEGRA